MSVMRDLPARLQNRGIEVRFLPAWNDAQHIGFWVDDEPYAHMHHHTATAAYTPNREKANGYAGLSIDGSERLYQEDYDGTATPVYVFANLYPAPISSGAGDVEVLEAIRRGDEVSGRPGPDTPGWYGNKFYWNTEWVLNGIGAPVDDKVWAMMVIVCQEQNDLMGWSRINHIMHGTHTNRKPDLWAGQYLDFDATLAWLRQDMDKEQGMNLERWATRLRNPIDFDQMAAKGVITEAERDYWITVATDSGEMQDLRDAIEVRNPLWTN